MKDEPPIPIHESSGSVFRDLEFPDPDLHLLKAHLVRLLGEAIRRHDLSSDAAAEVAGCTTAHLSSLLSGRFRQTRVEQLLHLLLAFGYRLDLHAWLLSGPLSDSAASDRNGAGIESFSIGTPPTESLHRIRKIKERERSIA